MVDYARSVGVTGGGAVALARPACAFPAAKPDRRVRPDRTWSAALSAGTAGAGHGDVDHRRAIFSSSRQSRRSLVGRRPRCPSSSARTTATWDRDGREQ